MDLSLHLKQIVFLKLYSRFEHKLEAVQLETGEQLWIIKYDTYKSGDEIFSISKVKKIKRCTKCSFIN